jgi:hypothetical protein
MGCLGFMHKKIFFLPALAGICLCLFQCQKPYEDRFRPIQKWEINYEDTTGHRKRVKGDAAEGSYYTTSTYKDEWADCFKYVIPDSLYDKDIRILVDCSIRKCEHGSAQCLVVHAIKINTDNLFLWSEFQFDDYTQKINTWDKLSDSTEIHIPKKLNSADSIELRIVGWNPAHYSHIDLDDLKIELKEVKRIYKK